MGKLILPIAPFEKRHSFTREGVQYEAVKGYSEEGLSYGHIEKVELEKGIYKAKLMCTRKNEYLNLGKLDRIEVYWAWHYFNSVTGELEKVEPECHIEVVYADKIFFSAYLGEKIFDSMLNGAVRGRPMGFNEQPIISPLTGEFIPDETVLEGGTRDEENSYDTTQPADREAYGKTQPEYEDEPTA
jgi:hypothetical protein